MSAKNVTLHDENGNILLPATKTSRVTDANGTNLDTLLQQAGQVKSISVNGVAQTIDGNGNVNIASADGVGIASVVQTTTSTEDGGTNVITVTKTDNTTSTFSVKNGSKGSTGATGPQGERGPQGNTGVTVESVNSIIHSIDPTATYAAADVAGADAVQDVLAEVTELAGKTPELDSQHDSDLDIADEFGNVLARFKDGEIQTKNFNSLNVSNIVEGESNIGTDFEIADNNNNIIVQFLNGHIKTKYFNSTGIGYVQETIRPVFFAGNAINLSTGQGEEIKFGVAESSALSYIHTQIYNVQPSTKVSFDCDINTVDLHVCFIDDNYLVTSIISNIHSSGNTWQNCEVDIPSNATGMVIEASATDGNGNTLHSINLTVSGYFLTYAKTRFFKRNTDDGYQHLTMAIGLTSMQNSYDVTNVLNVETSYYVDHGLLCLPSSYSPQGKPTRLICFCHGHAVTYASGATRFNSNDIKPEYWLSEGYAIFDMDGSVTGTFSGNHDYEPSVVNSYDTAYQWIVAHYNIRTDGVFATGRSMGGGMQFVLAKRSSMPIIASAPIVPYTNPLGYVGGPMKDTQRKELLKSYGLTDAELAEGGATWTGTTNKVFHQLTSAQKNIIITYQWKFIQYSPAWLFNKPLTQEEADYWSRTWTDRTDADMESYFDSVQDKLNVSLFNNIPFFLFTCVGDQTVWYKEVVTMHRLLVHAGSLAFIHVYPASETAGTGGDHRFEINSENLVTYTNSKGITLSNIPKVYIEILAFWRRFENQDNNSNN